MNLDTMRIHSEDETVDAEVPEGSSVIIKPEKD